MGFILSGFGTAFSHRTWIRIPCSQRATLNHKYLMVYSPSGKGSNCGPLSNYDLWTYAIGVWDRTHPPGPDPAPTARGIRPKIAGEFQFK